MIESRLDGQTDGLSFSGKYQEYSVAELAEQFRYLATEGRARSVSSVLRIVSEQTRGRSSTTANPVALLTVLLAMTLIYGGARLYAAHDANTHSVSPTALLACLDVACGAYCWISRDRRRRYAAQADEVRRLALETLGVIVGRGGFLPRALTKEERKTFASLRSTDPEGWLQVAKALARNSA